MSENNLKTTYDPSEMEDRIYKNWVDNGYFTADPDSDKEPFTIVIPPPNVTGQLHMGHALDETLQDILIRYKRMAGYEALWVPGTDHAGIATQIKVEEALRVDEGLTRYDLGREKFLDRVWDWKNKYGDRIITQLKKLGSSCDWTRERFTMDEGCSEAVRKVFVSLYEKGLIYQGDRIINWCPHCITALSDAEVEYTEQAGHFWHIKYPVKDSDEFVVIATTRPETLFGDTAVAVNPEDERYTHLVGKTLILPLTNREIPVIADEYVDKEFGTGCVKITPAHDPNDFEVGARHNLEIIKVMNDDATLNAYAGKYEGMDRYECRKAMIKDLEEMGLLVKTEDHAHNVGQCYRCSTTVEPITSKQWFVKMAPLAEKAVGLYDDKKVEFVPDRFGKTFLNWMNNVHDWCISRQLWWGHRIPAFYCDKCGKTTVSMDNITVCPDCGGSVHQDPDVLDTWFSSALWPFSTLGWPNDTKELKKFFPTSVLVTGYDIIFFWVARMIFSSAEHMGIEPFKHIFIHGIVRDSQGRKMSKSLGNGIDPLEVIEKYGADALRFSLVSGNSPGNDMRFYWEKVESSRNFANKLWNASRFVMMNLDDDNDCTLPDIKDLEMEDKWIVSRLNQIVKEVSDNLDKFELGVALQKLYDFIWDELCDWYIELVKPRLYDIKSATRRSAQQTLTYVLANTLKLMHPYMPFITEEIYTHLPTGEETIMRSAWPVYNDELNFPQEEKDMIVIMNAIKAIRNRRTEMEVPPSKKAAVTIVTDDKELFTKGSVFFEKLASASAVTVTDEKIVADESTVSIISEKAEIFIPLDELIDREKELERLYEEKKRLEGEVARVNGKLNNKNFVDKAPEKVVNEEREKGIKYQAMLDSVIESINALK